MGFLDHQLKKGIRNGIGAGLGKALNDAIGQMNNNNANQQAQQSVQQPTYQQPVQQTYQQSVQQQAPAQSQKQFNAQSMGAFGGLFGAIQNTVMGVANEAAKNMKVCPNCNKATSADKKFCPDCGSALPEQTVAEGAVCTSCGAQNAIGTKFCASCGTKLPAAIQEEQAQAERNAAVLRQWDEKLPQYPKWSCGGTELYIEDYGENGFMLSATFNGNPSAAHRAVEEYRQILLQSGFRQAGQYPSIEQLFKRIDGVVYNVDTEHCFDGDPDTACIGFYRREPYGGFDYVKPEPKKKASFKDLFGL